MELYIVRHGIAVDREDAKCPPDPERFLTDEGKEKSRQAAKGVAQCQAGYVALAQNMLLSLAPQGIRRTDSWLMCASL